MLGIIGGTITEQSLLGLYTRALLGIFWASNSPLDWVICLGLLSRDHAGLQHAASRRLSGKAKPYMINCNPSPFLVHSLPSPPAPGPPAHLAGPPILCWHLWKLWNGPQTAHKPQSYKDLNPCKGRKLRV